MVFLLIFAEFFNDKAKVWHFYHDSVLSEEVEPKTVPELKKKLKVVLDEAIGQPTRRNVLKYMRLQKLLMDKSQHFAAAWEQTLIAHPELDPTIKMPTSYYGTLHAPEQQEKRGADQLKKHMKNYALFLVVDNGSTSAALKDVVEDMAHYRGYQVMIVNAQDQSHLLREFGIKRLPALLMVHLPTGKRSIITYSLISVDKIEERMVGNFQT